MTLVEISDLVVAYGQDRPVNGVNLTLDGGCVAITGPSGSGKSTLLRVVAGLQRPDSGTVLIDGAPVTPPGWRTAGDARVCVVHQDYRLVPFLNGEDNLRLATELRSVPPGVGLELSEALDAVHLPGSIKAKLPGAMSGGEQQRLAIARCLVSGARVVVADEPTGALDRPNSEAVAVILSHLGDMGIAVLVATHDERVAHQMTRQVNLVNGTLDESRSAA